MLRILLFLMPFPVMADSLVATRNLPVRTVISAEDVTLVAADIRGALNARDPAIGLEVRSAIYAGRPVRLEDLGPPALVERNARVTLAYRSGALTILAEGRALARGGVGERISALNLASKATVTGSVTAEGQILVGGMP